MDIKESMKQQLVNVGLFTVAFIIVFAYSWIAIPVEVIFGLVACLVILVLLIANLLNYIYITDINSLNYGSIAKNKKLYEIVADWSKRAVTKNLFKITQLRFALLTITFAVTSHMFMALTILILLVLHAYFMYSSIKINDLINSQETE